MGFEIERFEGDVDEELICPICSEVLEDPLQAPNCEHAFCCACIKGWISRQPTCPVDRQPVTASQLRPVPRILRNLLSRLRTSCDYAPHGCNAVLKLESLESHLIECEFNPKKLVPCEAGCGLVIPKDEVAEHNCVLELRALIATHQEMLNNYAQELAEHKRAHQEKLNEYKQELAEHKRAHQEKLNEYEQELAEHKRAHQEKLNDYEQELAEHKRAHQEKLNDYEQELADLKRELAVLKEFTLEMRQLNASTQALADQRREEVVRWSNSLARTSEDYCDSLPVFRTPGNELKMSIKRRLAESGCPHHIIDDLVNNCEFKRWPSFVRSQFDGSIYETYVCRRLPGTQAVLILDCDNTHMDKEHTMVKPGFILIYT